MKRVEEFALDQCGRLGAPSLIRRGGAVLDSSGAEAGLASFVAHTLRCITPDECARADECVPAAMLTKGFQMEWRDGFGESVADPVSVPEHAYATIKGALLSGQIKSGSVLVQDDIAKTLGFSRVPVREALKRLEGEGFVVLRPRRGYVVVDLDADAVEDILDVRKELEGLAGYLATLRRTAEDVAAVRRLFDAHRETLDRGQDGAQQSYERSRSVSNREFHERLFQPCGRPYLLKLLHHQFDLVMIYIAIGGSIAPDAAQTIKDHEAILDAYVRQDAAAVAELSRAHVEHTKQRLVRKLRNAK